MILILTGVSGSGKTTIGKLLSKRTGWPFRDGDDFHSPENIAKMQRGEPLDDADRAPWLLSIRSAIEAYLEAGQSAIFACSALKASYREVLRRDDKRIHFVLLQGSSEIIADRLALRKGHYMPATLLQSQIDALEPLDNGTQVSVEQSPELVADEIASHFHLRRKRNPSV
ncbi:MAG: gluconokinase [Bacteroidia bacterium]